MPNPCPHVNSTSLGWDSVPGTILVSGDLELLTENDRFKNKIKQVSTRKLKSLPKAKRILMCLFSTGFPQIIDEEETQFMSNCPVAVTESTPRRRTRIQVFWIAPPAGTGCVILK